jgi:protein-S-isoprenylcysteine O-methyltransferase Ste14
LGLLIGIIAITKLGQNLTPLPHPKDDSELVTHGVYAWVRHPIYSSLILISLGWALLNSSPLTFFITLLLGIFLDIKSRREEQYLQDKFAAYVDYKKRVKKFVPFVY